MTAKRKKTSSKKASKSAESTGNKKPGTTRPDEMSDEVMEFITAIDDYKRKNERPFPNWSEILEVLKGLGYEKEAVD